MPKPSIVFDRKYRCRITNARKPKADQIVIRTHYGHLIALRNGRALPWPADFQLVLRGKVQKHIGNHLARLSEKVPK